jgi:D-aminoacyl-tRNA deacylase
MMMSVVNMRALLQRVRKASVSVNGEICGAIDQGLLVFIGIEKHDRLEAADKLLDKILAYRVFSDEQGKMNLSLRDIKGGLLLVSQFTLAADTKKGLRPGFSSAAPPQEAAVLFAQLIAAARVKWSQVETGQFGADMQVALVNDGPVTFLLSA